MDQESKHSVVCLPESVGQAGQVVSGWGVCRKIFPNIFGWQRPDIGHLLVAIKLLHQLIIVVVCFMCFILLSLANLNTPQFVVYPKDL